MKLWFVFCGFNIGSSTNGLDVCGNKENVTDLG